MSITIKSNTDTILELPGFTGTLGPGKSSVVPAMTPDLLRAVDLGLLLVPSGAEPPDGLPPVVFDHRYPHVLPLTAGRAYYVRLDGVKYLRAAEIEASAPSLLDFCRKEQAKTEAVDALV